MKIILGEIMQKKDITFEQLSHLSGISTSTLHRIATTKTSPSMDKMEMLAMGLGMRITNLYESEYK